MHRIRRSRIDQRIGVLKDVRKKVLFEGVELEIAYDNIMNLLARFEEAESYEYRAIREAINKAINPNQQRASALFLMLVMNAIVFYNKAVFGERIVNTKTIPYIQQGHTLKYDT